jgi:signal transduction histidine kinase
MFAAILLVSVTALAIFYFATTTVIKQAFEKVEDDNITVNTARAVDALVNRVDQLVYKVVDWANWDDTYQFVRDRNADYIKSNLGSESLINLGVHYMLFYNERGQLVHSKAVRSDNGTGTTVPSALLDAFQPSGNLLAKTPESQAKGVLALPDRLVQFVALPILTSEGVGPLRGTLVFGFDLTPAEVEELSNVTHLKLSFHRINDPNRPDDVKAAIGEPKEPRTAILKPTEQVIVGYQTINDAFGKPALVARVTRARDIHQTAASTITRFSLITLLNLGLAALLIAVLYMNLRGKDKTIALKNEFFSIASHELRTPLTVIRDYAQLMKFQFSKTVKDPKFDHMAEQIDQAGAQLIGVVNVYLDAARLESGKIPFQPQPFSICDIAKSLGPQLQAAGKTKNVSVIMDCPDTLPLVMGDKERIQQVILNLFGNAMKFTDQGSITIKGEAKGNFVFVYVTDTGRGMDEAAQRKLFQRFSQVQSKDALRGSGLGLFISKKLVEQMGGSIQVESSAPGIGSTLSFSLPVAPPPAPAPAAPAASAPPPYQPGV